MTQNISSFQANLAPNIVLDSIIKVSPIAAYIHIPFCRRRCYYCDFPISVVGDKILASSEQFNKSQAANSITMIEEYISALITEIKLAPKAPKPLQTIFFGGGTPSLLSTEQLATVLQAIARYLGIAADAEISMEIDPGTFNREKLLGYLDAGINRISLGIQSFDEMLLKVCGRSHSVKEIMDGIDLIKQIGVNNFSLDLISGLPHQTLEQCRASCLQAIAVAPTHLSCYDLVLEPVTAFGKQYRPGKKPLPNDETAAQMYRLTQQLLTEAGYEHYEVSNYARAGYQCRHNRVYWENQPYYGFGMGAASYVNGKRFTRPRTRREYYAWLEAGAIIDTPTISAKDWLLETLMLGLRLAEGISLSQFDPSTLDRMKVCLRSFHSRGWVEVINKQQQVISLDNIDASSKSTNRLRLSDPEGFLFSNTILAALFEALE